MPLDFDGEPIPPTIGKRRTKKEIARERRIKLKTKDVKGSLREISHEERIDDPLATRLFEMVRSDDLLLPDGEVRVEKSRNESAMATQFTVTIGSYSSAFTIADEQMCDGALDYGYQKVLKEISRLYTYTTVSTGMQEAASSMDEAQEAFQKSLTRAYEMLRKPIYDHMRGKDEV